MNAAGKLGEKEIVLKAGDFNGRVGSNRKNYEDQHEVIVMKIGTGKGKGFWRFV